jgi:hypothetical protein
MLFPEVEHHYVRTFKQRVDRLDTDALETVFRTLEREGADALAQEGFDAHQRRFERLVDLRYTGANSELTLPVAAGDGGASLRTVFDAGARAAIRLSLGRRGVEIMNVRVIARGGRGLAGARAAVPVRRVDAGGERANGVLRSRIRRGADAGLRAWRPRQRMDQGSAARRGVRQHDRGPARTDGRASSHGTRSKSRSREEFVMNRLADAQELAPTGRALDRDPFALELIKNALVALADEMALTVYRTARSFVVKRRSTSRPRCSSRTAS